MLLYFGAITSEILGNQQIQEARNFLEAHAQPLDDGERGAYKDGRGCDMSYRRIREEQGRWLALQDPGFPGQMTACNKLGGGK